jgi:hypothetical protein
MRVYESVTCHASSKKICSLLISRPDDMGQDWSRLHWKGIAKRDVLVEVPGKAFSMEVDVPKGKSFLDGYVVRTLSIVYEYKIPIPE